MKNLTICLPDGTFDGIVHMHSSSSAFSAFRIPRSQLASYGGQLNQNGVYMFLIGDRTVYVGQSGQTLIERISKTHTGTIDADWHTLIAFPCAKLLSDNELHFIENALCEYAHLHCPRCATFSPSRGNCNEKYRNKHYGLTPMGIAACNEYVEHIKFYISHLQDSIFVSSNSTASKVRDDRIIPKFNEQPELQICNESSISNCKKQIETFHFFSKKQDAEGYAEIEIHLGRDVQRPVILKKGARVSVSVSTAPKFTASKRIIETRKQLELEGKLKDRILLEDIELSAPSFAASFLSGTSLAGTDDWKNNDGVTFGELK